MPVASVGACLADFAISFGILIGMMFYYHMSPSLSILMVVPLVLVTILSALGIGVLVSALNTAYRDFRYALPFLVQGGVLGDDCPGEAPLAHSAQSHGRDCRCLSLGHFGKTVCMG